jgi:transcriptional regulator with XRE-family HTH domain
MSAVYEEQIRKVRGDALRRHRRLANLSAEALARKINEQDPQINISKDAIYSYENARVRMSNEVGRAAAEVLGLLPGELLPDLAGSGPDQHEANHATGSAPIEAGREHSNLDRVSLAQRIELVKRAEALVPALIVMTELIPKAASPGNVDLSRQLDLFSHALDQTAALNQLDATQEVLVLGSVQGLEHLHRIAELCRDLHQQLDEFIRSITRLEPLSSYDLNDKCMRFVKAIRGIVIQTGGEDNLIDAINKWVRQYPSV